jgi:hypothetical protein
MEEFDVMLENMTSEEVMDMLVKNGYDDIKPPSEYGYVLENDILDIKKERKRRCLK